MTQDSNIRNLIRKILFEEHFIMINMLSENVQLAEKIYFNTKKLSKQDKEIILKITGGNNYTYIISAIYYILSKHQYPYAEQKEKKIKDLMLLYNDIQEYNKNVFPIKDFDIIKFEDDSNNMFTLIANLQNRRQLIREMKKLPSIAIRNLKTDIRIERDYKELNSYLQDLQYFISHYSLLSNRDEKIQNKILQKMFKGNTTLSQLMRFVDDKQNFIGGVSFTKNTIKKLAQTEDIEIIYEKGPVMIIRVDSPEGIRAIGCNSLWCFTYGSGFDNAYQQWNNYSYNDIVYVLVDFRENSDSENFMHVLITPITDEDDNLIDYTEDNNNENEVPLYNMSNEQVYNLYGVLSHLFGSGYENVIKNYLNFGY